MVKSASARLLPVLFALAIQARLMVGRVLMCSSQEAMLKSNTRRFNTSAVVVFGSGAPKATIRSRFNNDEFAFSRADDRENWLPHNPRR